MRHLPLLLIAAAAFCAEDGTAPPRKGGPDPAAIAEATTKAFTAGDADKDGKLSRSEFPAAAAAFREAMHKSKDGDASKRKEPPKATDEMLDKAFAAGDADADSALTTSEFPAAMKALRPPRPAKDGGAPPPQE